MDTERQVATKGGKFRKKPVVVEAHQWFKNGDHPQDDSGRMRDSGIKECEGAVVRYFRLPGVKEDMPCPHCHQHMSDHGWIDTVQGGHTVCPGDWIITDDRVSDPRGHGHFYPCKPDIFAATYEPAT